jgi:hypothetical protein
MRANELIPILSELFDYPFDAAYRIDRVLAEAGMRARGKGRNLPDMHRREALIFLVACMVSDKITRANEEVFPWLSARGKVNKAPSLTVNRQWNIPDDTSAEYRHHVAMEKLLAPHKDPKGKVRLIDYLLALCVFLQDGCLQPQQIQFRIDFSDMSATFVCLDEDGDEFLTDQFFVIDPVTDRTLVRPRVVTGIKRSCSANGATLLGIVKRT